MLFNEHKKGQPNLIDAQEQTALVLAEAFLHVKRTSLSFPLPQLMCELVNVYM